MNVYNEDLTVAEAAVVLKVTDQTVRGWIKNGKLNAFKNMGGRWRIPRTEVERARGVQAGERAVVASAEQDLGQA